MATTPTARTLALLRREGYLPAVVERRLPRGFVTVDLYNAFDVVAVRADRPGVLAVQTTSTSNGASRWAKLLAAPVMRTWLQAGNAAELWTWKKKGGRWECARRPVTLADLDAAPQAGSTPETFPDG